MADESLKFPCRDIPLTQAEEIIWARYINHWGETAEEAARAGSVMSRRLDGWATCGLSLATFLELFDNKEDDDG